MSNANMDGLPPEMQARIANIIEQAKVKAQNPPESPHQAAIATTPAPAAPAAPLAPVPPKPPNLMDHVIMLRQEVDAMRQQIAAMGQVTEAVGNAVGQLYAMFQSQTEPTYQGADYQAPEREVGDF